VGGYVKDVIWFCKFVMMAGSSHSTVHQWTKTVRILIVVGQTQSLY